MTGRLPSVAQARHLAAVSALPAAVGSARPLAAGAGAVDIEQAAVRHHGDDVTIVAYGGTLRTALPPSAAKQTYRRLALPRSICE